MTKVFKPDWMILQTSRLNAYCWGLARLQHGYEMIPVEWRNAIRKASSVRLTCAEHFDKLSVKPVEVASPNVRSPPAYRSLGRHWGFGKTICRHVMNKW
jgi:hypothetical protein